jgi:hypothetical protein
MGFISGLSFFTMMKENQTRADSIKFKIKITNLAKEVLVLVIFLF